MGATYISIQADTTDRENLLSFTTAFVEKRPHEFQCYVGEPLGRWTAVYPSLSPAMDVFAKELSKALGCLALTLVSEDEDAVFCNFCQAGKDLSFFKISTGAKRSPKQQAPVAKKLALLGACLSEERQKELVKYLSDTTGILFSADILTTFCDAVGIRNARTSYNYIEKSDYLRDLDSPVALVKIGSGSF
jgi:hypothetical protein